MSTIYGLEWKFRIAKALLTKKIIKQSAFYDRANSLHFMTRNSRFYQLDYDGNWLNYDFDAQTWQEAGSDAAKRRKREKVSLITISSILVVLTVLFLIPGDWFRSQDLFSTAGSSQAKTQQTTALPTVSRTPAYEAELAPGFKLNAPAGSLKGNEKFQLQKLDTMKAWELTKGTGMPYPVVFGFEFDAGMKENESFNKPVTLEIDLDRMGVPAELRDNLTIYRMGANGPEELRTTIEKNILTFQTTKNSYYWSCPAAVIIGLSLMEVITLNDKYGSGGIIGGYYSLKLQNKKYSGYNLMWPKDLKDVRPRDESKLQEIMKDVEAVQEKFDLKWSNEERRFVSVYGILANEDEYYDALIAAKKSEEYQRLEKEFDDPKFLLKYVLPEKVAVVAEALMSSHDYLFETRGFDRIVDSVDIVMRDPWPPEWSEVPGAADDKLSTYPYLSISLPAIWTKREVEEYVQSLKKAGRMNAKAINEELRDKTILRDKSQDDLLMTISHELFHITQLSYKNINLKSDKHFSEATAALLEAEAFAYYKSQGKIKSKNYQLSLYDDYQLLETEWGKDGDYQGEFGDSIAMNHGYTFYHALQYSRDRDPSWRTAGKDQFLKKLMDWYKDFDPQTSLHLVAYPGMLKDYVKSAAPTILNKLQTEVFKNNKNTYRLSSLLNILPIKDDAYRPDSIKGFQIGATDPGPGAAVLMHIKIRSKEDQEYINLLTSNDPISDSMKFTPVPAETGIYILPAATSYLLATQQFEPDLQTNPPQEPVLGIELNLAQKPIAPVAEYDAKTNEFVIRLAKNRLYQSALFKGQILEIQQVSGNAPVTRLFVEKDTDEIRIPVEELLRARSNQVNLLERLIAKAIHGAFISSLNVAKRMDVEGITITDVSDELDNLTIDGLPVSDLGRDVFKVRFDQKKSPSDSDEVSYFSQEITMGLNSYDGIFQMVMKTDKDYYLNVEMKAKKIIEYVTYLRLADPSYVPALKEEFENYDKGFVMTSRDLFSTTSVKGTKVISVDQAMGKLVQTVTGPESDKVDLKTKKPEYADYLAPGIYGGSMFIDFQTNMAEKQVTNMIGVEVTFAQEVIITTFDQTLYGKLVPTETPGRFQYYSRVKQNNAFSYVPVENAYAAVSKDGALVFSFLPAVFWRY